MNSKFWLFSEMYHHLWTCGHTWLDYGEKMSLYYHGVVIKWQFNSDNIIIVSKCHENWKCYDKSPNNCLWISKIYILE